MAPVRTGPAMKGEQEVLFANEAFYQAFAERDLDAMAEVWAREMPVACVHPGWEALAGRDAVLASWRAILESPSAPAIRCLEPQAFAFGDVAFVICYEAIEQSVPVATNIFVREDGVWRLVHHQAGPTNHRPRDEAEPSGSLH
jgi:ketosteroid isomerase-like protein